MDCFCLDLYATGGAKTTGPVGNQLIQPFVDGIDIVDIKPDAMENMINCYALLALNQGILPSMGQMISKFAFNNPLPPNLGSIIFSAATSVPNNPAIEDDQLKAFINLDTINLNLNIPPTICQSSGGGGGGGGGGGTVTRTTRG